MGFFDSLTGGVSDIVSSGIGVVGGILGNKSSAKQAQLSRDQSVDIAKHSHQWEVADLKKAGLNPILSANNGASVSSLPTAQQSNPFDGVGDTFNSARKISEVDKRSLDIQDRKVDSEVGMNHAIMQNQYAQDWLNQKNTEVAEETRRLTSNNANNAALTGLNLIEQGNAIRAATAKDMSQVRLNSALGQKVLSEKSLVDYDIQSKEYGKDVERYTAPIDKATNSLGNILDAVNPVRMLRTKKPKR